MSMGWIRNKFISLQIYRLLLILFSELINKQSVSGMAYLPLKQPQSQNFFH